MFSKEFAGTERLGSRAFIFAEPWGGLTDLAFAETAIGYKA